MGDLYLPHRNIMSHCSYESILIMSVGDAATPGAAGKDEVAQGGDFIRFMRFDRLDLVLPRGCSGVPRKKRAMTIETESFDDVVLPPSDNRQLRALDHLLHETTPPTLRGADGEETILPMEVYNVLVDVVAAMNKGMAIVLAPRNQRLTTREAADYLGVSRPTLVRLLEDEKIPYDQPSRHRYVYLSDLAEYKQGRRHARRGTLAEMTKDAAAAGLYDRPESAEEVAAALKKVRKRRADAAKP